MMAAAAATLETLADDLAAAAPGWATRPLPKLDGDPQDVFPMSPVVGLANPVAPPVRVWSVTGDEGQPEIRGTVRFGQAYEGPPGCVHGGVIAQTFDELLGVANVVAGNAGMTGRLTIHYRRPTPLRQDLDLVSRQVGVDGRKVHTWAAIYSAGELTAEAEGLFIVAPPGRIAEIATTPAG
jgi:acyl-coenzyme A thioesterase PaaI-like protein